MVTGRSRRPRYPWEVSYPDGVDWDLEIPVRPLFDLLDQAVATHRDRPCLDFLGRRHNYGEIAELVAKAARGFQDLGVAKGVKVGLFLPNCPYFLVCYFGVLKAGGTIVAYNPLLAERELARQICDSETEILVTLDLARLYDKIAAVRREVNLRRLIICSLAAALPFPKSLIFRLFKRADLPRDSRHMAFDHLIDNRGDFRPPDIEPGRDIAALLFTGGTTGEPKGVCLSHTNLFANALQSAAFLGFAERGYEKVLAVIPFFHAFGMTAIMNTSIALGAELILLPRFKVGELLATIDRKKPTLFAGVPTIFKAIVGCKDRARYDLSSLKACTSGGDSLPIDVKESFERQFDCPLLEGYGLTECSPVATTTPIGARDKPGSVGLPLPGTVVEVISLEDRRMPVALGERGEICISGPQVMLGYLRNPAESADVMRDGRLHSGDVGYLDTEGYTFLVDRIKDVIITGGYSVYPSMIESAILQHPAIAEVAVVGAADDYWGQQVTAYIVVKDHQSITPGELLAFLADKISPLEQPKQVLFRGELPKSALGKVLKSELLGEKHSPPQPADASDSKVS